LYSKILIINILIIFNNKILKNIKKQYKFVSNIQIFKIFLNKLEIYMQFSFIKYTKKYIENLQYILLLRAYLSYTSSLDSTSLKQIYYYTWYAREANILNIMFDIFDKQVLRAIILAILNKQAKQTISIFLIYRKSNITFL